jgi:conjugal transfer pilus assembly protein TraE
MHTLMTTSSDTVEAQVAEIEVISSISNKELQKFLKNHIGFIKGSSISSVFFPKDVLFEEGAVVVSGLFKYWFGESKNPISANKVYRLCYKRGVRDILLLKEVKELTSEEFEAAKVKNKEKANK